MESKELRCRLLRLLEAMRLVLLIVRVRRQDLVSGASYRYMGSMATNLALGHWYLGLRARRLPDGHRQGQAGSSGETVTMARQLLVVAEVVVVRCSSDLDVIFIMFRALCTFAEFYNRSYSFFQQKKL